MVDFQAKHVYFGGGCAPECPKRLLRSIFHDSGPFRKAVDFQAKLLNFGRVWAPERPESASWGEFSRILAPAEKLPISVQNSIIVGGFGPQSAQSASWTPGVNFPPFWPPQWSSSTQNSTIFGGFGPQNAHRGPMAPSRPKRQTVRVFQRSPHELRDAFPPATKTQDALAPSTNSPNGSHFRPAGRNAAPPVSAACKSGAQLFQN